ncbi:MAG: HAD family hydrolase [Dehalococcoidia bacterium]|jgi:FMN hydrolase / 5-amino-6-(5-phospho-D-ribitylamino)uracil phosphatase|nr:HAD family hydrolase [Dehalococcoidia bacterium]
MTRPPFRVSHILLDVDGTLINFQAALEQALLATAELASEVTGTLVTPMQLGSARELVYAEPTWRERTLREVRDESFRRVLAAAGETALPLVERVSAVYYETRDREMLPYEETDEVLAALRDRGFTLIAGTNGNATLSQYQFRHHLMLVHQAERAGFSKPDPRFYRGALERAGASVDSTISVGDRVANDIDGPRAIGMAGIFLDRENVAPDIDVPRITTLRELPDLVELG